MKLTVNTAVKKPPGLMDEVAEVTPEEEKRYTEIDFDTEEYRKDLGHSQLIHNKDKVSIVWIEGWKKSCRSFFEKR